MNTALAEELTYTEPTPLFGSARAAMRFAVTRDGNPCRPVQSRMTDTTTGKRELAGLDGAAQAGMILNIVGTHGPLAVAVMTADVAPRSKPCSCRRACCKGHADNHEWAIAIDTICQYATTYIPINVAYALRSAIVRKIYGETITMPDIAARTRLHVNTVGNHHATIRAWLKGAKADKNGGAIQGVEPAAWSAAETSLRNYGIVG
jgi:hypothetical protein